MTCQVVDTCLAMHIPCQDFSVLGRMWLSARPTCPVMRESRYAPPSQDACVPGQTTMDQDGHSSLPKKGPRSHHHACCVLGRLTNTHAVPVGRQSLSTRCARHAPCRTRAGTARVPLPARVIASVLSRFACAQDSCSRLLYEPLQRKDLRQPTRAHQRWGRGIEADHPGSCTAHAARS